MQAYVRRQTPRIVYGTRQGYLPPRSDLSFFFGPFGLGGKFPEGTRKQGSLPRLVAILREMRDRQ